MANARHCTNRQRITALWAFHSMHGGALTENNIRLVDSFLPRPSDLPIVDCLPTSSELLHGMRECEATRSVACRKTRRESLSQALRKQCSIDAICTSSSSLQSLMTTMFDEYIQSNRQRPFDLNSESRDAPSGVSSSSRCVGHCIEGWRLSASNEIAAHVQLLTQTFNICTCWIVPLLGSPARGSSGPAATALDTALCHQSVRFFQALTSELNRLRSQFMEALNERRLITLLSLNSSDEEPLRHNWTEVSMIDVLPHVRLAEALIVLEAAIASLYVEANSSGVLPLTYLVSRNPDPIDPSRGGNLMSMFLQLLHACNPHLQLPGLSEPASRTMTYNLHSAASILRYVVRGHSPVHTKAFMCHVLLQSQVENLHPLPTAGQAAVLFSVAQSGHDQYARLLLECMTALDSTVVGVAVNTRNAMGVTALWQAAWKGHTNVCRILLEFGARSNTTDAAGVSAVEVALRYGHRPVMTLLLNHGADVTDRLLSEARRLDAVTGCDSLTRVLIPFVSPIAERSKKLQRPTVFQEGLAVFGGWGFAAYVVTALITIAVHVVYLLTATASV